MVSKLWILKRKINGSTVVETSPYWAVGGLGYSAEDANNVMSNDSIIMTKYESSHYIFIFGVISITVVKFNHP